MAGQRGPAPPATPKVPTGGSTQPKRATKTLTTLQNQVVPNAANFFSQFGVSTGDIAALRGVNAGAHRGKGYDHRPVANTPDLTVQQVEALFTHLPPAQQAQIQDLLYRGGFYGTGSTFTPLYGHLKEQDFAAFESAIAISVAQGQGIGEYLRGSADAADKTGLRDASAMHKVGPHVVTLADPNALNASLESAFTQAIGRAPNADERAKFVTSFHAQEAAYQEQVQTAQDAGTAGALASQQPATGTPESQGLKYVSGQGWIPDPNFKPTTTAGGTVPAGPTVTLINPSADVGAIAQQVEQAHPGEFNAFQLGRHGQEILNVLTGSTPGGYAG